jgi:carbonic anhydrase
MRNALVILMEEKQVVEWWVKLAEETAAQLASSELFYPSDAFAAMSRFRGLEHWLDRFEFDAALPDVNATAVATDGTSPGEADTVDAEPENGANKAEDEADADADADADVTATGATVADADANVAVAVAAAAAATPLPSAVVGAPKRPSAADGAATRSAGAASANGAAASRRRSGSALAVAVRKALDPTAPTEKRAGSVLAMLARSAPPLGAEPSITMAAGHGADGSLAALHERRLKVLGAALDGSGPSSSPRRRRRSGYCSVLHDASHRRTFAVACIMGATLAALFVGLAARAALPGPAAPRIERVAEPFWPAEPLVDSASSWSYAPSEPNGPPRWGVMADPATGAAYYPNCAAAGGQSPIDLPAMPSAAALPLAERAFSYPAEYYAVQPRPKGHPGFQLEPCAPAAAGSNCSGGGLVASPSNASVDFPLAQLHFHRPSEHSVNGQGFAFEMHVVHLDAGTGAVAEVLSVLFPAAESHNAHFDSFWLELHRASVVGRVALEQLLADTMPGTWSYTGSLTTPPCSGGVRWTVRLSNTGVNALQVLVFEYALGGLENRRATQPLAGRTVDMSVWRR